MVGAPSWARHLKPERLGPGFGWKWMIACYRAQKKCEMRDMGVKQPTIIQLCKYIYKSTHKCMRPDHTSIYPPVAARSSQMHCNPDCCPFYIAKKLKLQNSLMMPWPWRCQCRTAQCVGCSLGSDEFCDRLTRRENTSVVLVRAQWKNTFSHQGKNLWWVAKKCGSENPL